jgi:hypothetical protein
MQCQVDEMQVNECPMDKTASWWNGKFIDEKQANVIASWWRNKLME